MNNSSGAIDFDAYIRTVDFDKGMAAMERRVLGFTQNVNKNVSSIEPMFASLAKVAGGYFAFSELASLPQKLIQVRGEFQNLEIAFETMLGSKSKADALFKDVVSFSASTPFDLKGVSNATKQLLAYGFASQDIIGTLRRLGDVSAGLSIPLGELTELYGKTKTNGRLFGEDFNQFVGRGIPLTKLLSEQFGVAESKVRDLVEQGKVGFPEIERAINKLTDAGGMFAGLTEKSAKSLTGLYSNFQDSVDRAFNGIGKSQEGLLSDSIKFATKVIDNYEPIIDVLKVIVAGYGAYRAALIATAALQALPSAQLFVAEYLAMGKALGFATANQIAFNGAILANPYAIAAAAIVGLVVAVALFRDTTTEAEKAQQRIANVNEKVTESLAGESSKIQTLVAQIKNENVSRGERNNKLKELISIHPQLLDGITLENIATEKGTKAINDYIEARKRQIEVEQLNAELTESIKRQLEAKNSKNELGFLSTLGNSFASAGQSSFTAGTGTNFAKLQADETKKLNADIVKSEGELQKKILERVTALQTADAAASKSGKNTKEVVEKNIAYYDNEIKRLSKLQAENSKNRGQFLKYQKDIDDAERAKNRIIGGKTKADKAADKEAEKSGPYGSTSYWDYISGKAKEVLANIPTDQTGRINAQKDVIAEIERKAEQARKLTATKTFEDELEEKKKLYKSYQLWVDNLGQEAADQQFDGLITKGKSYAAYLNSQIGNLESVHPDSLTGQEQERLVKLKVEYSDITNSETPLQKFQKRLDGIRKSATSLTDEIIQLQKVQSELSPTDMSPDAIAMRQSAKQQEIDAANERKNQFREYAIEVAGSEQKRLEIEKRFKDLRVELENRYAQNKNQAYQKELEALNVSEQEAYQEDKEILAEKSKEYLAFVALVQKANEGISGGDAKTAHDNFKKFTTGLDKNSEKYKGYLKDLESLEEKHRKQSLQTWGLVADGIGQLGSVMSEIGGTFGEIGNALSGIASQAGNFSRVLSGIKTEQGKTTLSTDGYAAAITGVINLIGVVTSATQRRREAERQYHEDAIAFENDYQQALNKRLGQSYKQNENPYVNDIDAKIKSGVDQYEDAQDKYEEAIEKLNQGKAKTGQKIGVDGKSIALGAAAGAAAGVGTAVLMGAALGTVVGPVGTAVGAVAGLIVGGLTGLFGGKKKKDTFGGLLDSYPELVQESVSGWKSINVELAKALIANNQVDAKTKEMLQTAIDYNEAMEEAKQQIQNGIVEMTGQMGDSIRNALVTSFQEGTSAAEAFGKSVGDIMGNVVKSLLFAKLMKPAFDKFIEEANASYSIGGDGTLIDDLERFNSYGLPNAEAYVESLDQFDKWAKDKGFDNIFGKTDGKSSSALSGAIQGMSQQTAGVLEGQFNALRITSAESLVIHRDSNLVLRNQLLKLNEISYNTSFLLSIDKKLDKLNLLDANYNRAYGG